MLTAEKPLFGRSYEAYRTRLDELGAEGRLDAAILPFEHFHNDALQKLVTGGLTGLVVWLGILVAPLAFFLRQLRAAGISACRTRSTPALAGILLVACYAAFGLTEVIFWSVGGSLFYSLMVFVLMGFCLDSKEIDGKQEHRP